MQPKLQLKNQQTWLAIQSNAAKTLQFTNQQTWFGILYSQMQPKFSNSQTSKVGWHIIVKCSQNFPIHKSANLVGILCSQMSKNFPIHKPAKLVGML
jgi:hypothetical protein